MQNKTSYRQVSRYFNIRLYRNDLKNWFFSRRRPDFESGKAGADGTKSKKFSDAGELRNSGFPRLAKTELSSYFGILVGIAIALFSNALFSQNTYLGPTQPIPGDPHLVRIQLIVRDSPESGGVQIQSVEFNGQAVPLKPRDIYGNRGGASFQLPPGKRKLRWTVQRDKTIWPRTITREEEVNIVASDYWIQISIVGETASIN